MKVTVNTSSFAKKDVRPLDLLRAKGLAVVFNPHKRAMTADEVVALCKDADAIVAGTEPLNKDVLAFLPKLKVISRCGSGMSNVDQDEARSRGIKVFNTPGGPTIAVAELAVGVLLSLLRQTHSMDRAMRRGVWEKKMGNLLMGKILGIIGFGRIGQKVAELLKPFGADVIFVDPLASSPEYQKVSLEELLMKADIVTIHAAVESAQPILGKEEFARMKKGAWFMNLSRGEAVEEAALVAALREERLSGAAVDVFSQEPYEGPLKDMDNVIVTPHIGSYAAEARILMEIEAVENLLKGLGL